MGYTALSWLILWIFILYPTTTLATAHILVGLQLYVCYTVFSAFLSAQIH